MNVRLAEAAEAAVKAGRFETRAGYCLRFCREVDASIEGTLYDRLFRGDGSARDATAARAGHRFLARGLGFLAAERGQHDGLQAGDMLVKTRVARNRWGDFSGHIGVVCRDGKRVAENSSTSKGRVRGALGFRTLAEFGEFDIVVRLPRAATSTRGPGAVSPLISAQALVSGSVEAKFTFNHEPMPYAFFMEGRVMVPLVDFLHAQGFQTQAEQMSAKGGNIQGWKAPE